MKRSDGLSGLFFLLLAIIAAVESFRLEVGFLKNPGPGFLPFWTAILMGGLASRLILQNFWRKPEESFEEVWSGKVRWKVILAMMGILFGYALLLEPLGFVVVTGVFMLLILGWVEPQRWLVVLFLTLGATAGSYLLFQRWLKVQMPAGILGF